MSTGASLMVSQRCGSMTMPERASRIFAEGKSQRLRQVLEDLKMRPYQHVYTCDRGFAQSNLWLKPRNTLERTTSAKETDDLFNNMTPLFVKLRRRAAAAAKAMR